MLDIPTTETKGESLTVNIPSAERQPQCQPCRSGTADDAHCRNCHTDNTPGEQRCTLCKCMLRGSSLAMTHGGRRSPDHPNARAAVAAKLADLSQHLGDDLSVIQTDLTRDYAKLDFLIESVTDNLERGGIFTPKGSARAAVSMLLSLLDRRLRLAITLGIERKTKQIDLAQHFAAQERDR